MWMNMRTNMRTPGTTFKWASLATVLTLLLATVGVGVAQAQGGMITGVVTLPSGGAPPPGTVVKLFEPGGWDTLGRADVDPDGSFSLGPVPNGLYVLKALPPNGSGYTQSEPVPASVLGAPVHVGPVALTHPKIWGTVTAPDGVTPVPAEVWVAAGDGTLVQKVGSVGGTFLVGGLPSGSYSLRASPVTDDPYWPSPRQMVTVDGYTQTITLTLTAADLYGIVVDHLGHPVQNATVAASGDGGGGISPHRDLTSPGGYYAIGGLVTGTYRLTAEPPWYEGALLPAPPITVAIPGAVPPYTFTLGAPPKVVTGTVETNVGLPVQHAQVLAHRLDKSGRVETLSGSGGAYHLRLSDGLWALTVRPISTTTPSAWVYPNPPQLVHFRHDPDPEHKRIDFGVLTADAHVGGAVALPDGGTAALPLTVTVSLRNDEGVGREEAVNLATGAVSGTFDIGIPHGGYKVWVRTNAPHYMGPVVEPIRVPPNGVYNLGTLTLLARDGIITGTVSDEGGAGVPGIPVSAWRPGAPGGARAITGPDGQYVLPVVAGEWHVQPSPGPGQPVIYAGLGTRVVISSTETMGGINFELVTADATIVGRLVNEMGHPVTDAEGWASATQIVTPTLHNGAPIQSGGFSLFVPDGIYHVAAHLPAGSPYTSGGERRVSIAAGEMVTVPLTVQRKDARIVGGLWNPREEDVVEGVDAEVLAWAGGNWVGTAVDPGNGTFGMDVAAGLWHVGYRIDPQSDYVSLRQHKNVPVAAGQTATVPLPVVERNSLITGTVLGPDGGPVAGAEVIADGRGGVAGNLWLTTRSREDGRFVLRVPHGEYHLGATVGITDTIPPALRLVQAPVGGVSGGHLLQFRRPDGVISGAVSITPTSGITGTVLVWGWSEDDGVVRARVPVTDSLGAYHLDVTSNTTWHLGAVYETASQYWQARAEVVLSTDSATADLVLMGPHPKPAPVAVTFDSAQPERILLVDGTHIYLPANSLPVEGSVTLHITPIATLSHQRHANLFRYGYAFTAVDGSGQPITEHFNQDVVISFAYEERELWAAGINEHLLKPAYFSTTTDRWAFPESYVVDTEANRVVMHVDHFTDFALTGEAGFQVFLPVLLRQ